MPNYTKPSIVVFRLSSTRLLHPDAHIVEWADLWRHPSLMSCAGAARSAQQWSRLNVWSNAETGVNSPIHCWQTPCNVVLANVTCKAPAAIWRRHANAEYTRNYGHYKNVNRVFLLSVSDTVSK